MKDSREGLVCALADWPMTIPGSIYDRECCECYRRVMISPTGLKRLGAEPWLEIICLPCAERLDPQALDHATYVGPPEDFEREIEA